MSSLSLSWRTDLLSGLRGVLPRLGVVDRGLAVSPADRWLHVGSSRCGDVGRDRDVGEAVLLDLCCGSVARGSKIAGSATASVRRSF